MPAAYAAARLKVCRLEPHELGRPRHCNGNRRMSSCPEFKAQIDRSLDLDAPRPSSAGYAPRFVRELCRLQGRCRPDDGVPARAATAPDADCSGRRSLRALLRATCGLAASDRLGARAPRDLRRDAVRDAATRPSAARWLRSPCALSGRRRRRVASGRSDASSPQCRASRGVRAASTEAGNATSSGNPHADGRWRARRRVVRGLPVLFGAGSVRDRRAARRALRRCPSRESGRCTRSWSSSDISRPSSHSCGTRTVAEAESLTPRPSTLPADRDFATVFREHHPYVVRLAASLGRHRLCQGRRARRVHRRVPRATEISRRVVA